MAIAHGTDTARVMVVVVDDTNGRRWKPLLDALDGMQWPWRRQRQRTTQRTETVVDAWVLRDVGKASKRALEVRDELIGTVANSQLVSMAKHRVAESFVAPFDAVRSQARTTAADAIKYVLNVTGVGGSDATSSRA